MRHFKTVCYVVAIVFFMSIIPLTFVLTLIEARNFIWSTLLTVMVGMLFFVPISELRTDLRNHRNENN